jgi:hypothetical protein
LCLLRSTKITFEDGVAQFLCRITRAGRYSDPTGFSVDPGSYDVRDIMTHEAGHWILLNDLYNGKDSLLTMYGYGDYGEISKDTLGFGDELGIEKAYGP